MHVTIVQSQTSSLMTEKNSKWPIYFDFWHFGSIIWLCGRNNFKFNNGGGLLSRVLLFQYVFKLNVFSTAPHFGVKHAEASICKLVEISIRFTYSSVLIKLQHWFGNCRYEQCTADTDWPGAGASRTSSPSVHEPPANTVHKPSRPATCTGPTTTTPSSTATSRRIITYIIWLIGIL